MNFKNLFFTEEAKKAKEPKEITYATILGLPREFKFPLSKEKIADKIEFETVVALAEQTLEEDFERFGMEFEKIPPLFRNKIIGKVGAITVLGDDEGKLSVKFHLRNENGQWDGVTKKYPDKDTTAKYKQDIFFAVDDEEED